MRPPLVSLILAAFCACCVPAVETPAIKHRFLAVDESRGQLLLIDQHDPTKNWTLKLPMKSRDYQLIGNKQIMLNADNGYFVYDLDTRALVKEKRDPKIAGASSVRRLANGHTLIGCNKDGITVHELGADDAILRTARFADCNTLRLMRTTAKGTILFGCNQEFTVEADLDGKVLNRIKIPNGKHIYQVLRKPDDSWLIAGGYGHFIAELDSTGKEVRRIGGDPFPPELRYYFWAGFQVLKNGHVVVCNWTGHGPKDSQKGPQLIELDAGGKPVWWWHDAEVAGTLHGVIVLDDLDITKLNDDCTGTLDAVPAK